MNFVSTEFLGRRPRLRMITAPLALQRIRAPRIQGSSVSEFHSVRRRTPFPISANKFVFIRVHSRLSVSPAAIRRLARRFHGDQRDRISFATGPLEPQMNRLAGLFLDQRLQLTRFAARHFRVFHLNNLVPRRDRLRRRRRLRNNRSHRHRSNRRIEKTFTRYFQFKPEPPFFSRPRRRCAEQGEEKKERYLFHKEDLPRFKE
jgi:hypothetical protein